jgi:asparagine synthase (glutamine-hydrolysing)
MSGIVGILNIDGAPVDRPLLQLLTDFQAFRGPDAQQIWINENGGGHVGFGYTLLNTTEEDEQGYQPYSLDGKSWIVADARVDGRRELIATLTEHSRCDLKRATDVELILRAYDVWQEDCVEHLLGDFAFGIWDEARQHLFCARDHMGTKLLYYADLGSCVIFSNTLNCVRQHPVVSDTLNDSAIADFLLFEGNQNPGTTSFADIQRLPPAHRAIWSRSGLQMNRYWTMPIDEPIFYKRPDDYCDRFKELLREAVSDRLRNKTVAVFMSGGLDSTTLAATAKNLLQEQFPSFDLQAFTRTDPQIPEEQYYAELIADSFQISIHREDWAERWANPNWEVTRFDTPEPSSTPWQALAYQGYCQQISAYARVFLYGEGPDNALHFEWWPYVSYMARNRHYVRLFRDTCSTMVSQRRPPYWGRLSRKLKNAGTQHQPEYASFPDWLAPSLKSRLQLSARWEQILNPAQSIHPVRPKGYASLNTPLWQTVFERNDSGVTTAAFEVRCPFIDVRLLRFLLAVPPLPWCRSKYLIRRAMRGALPKPVLQRTKSGVACVDIMDRVGRFGLAPFAPTSALSTYVDATAIPTTVSDNMWDFGGHLRVRSLNHWLQYSHRKGHNNGRRTE